MRALFRRSHRTQHISFNEVTGEACDATCRSHALLEHARFQASTLLFR